MLERVQSIDRAAVRAVWFVTLTVPRDEASWSRIEKQRRAYFKRLRREWGTDWAAVWKKEPHKSGAPHLHLLVFWVGASPDVQGFRSWNDNAWADVVKSKNPAHRRVGCRVEVMRSWNGVACYCSKYLAKDAEFGEAGAGTGRIWGIENRAVLPVRPEGAVVPGAVGKVVARVLRKLQQRRREKCFAFIGGRWEQIRSQLVKDHAGNIVCYQDGRSIVESLRGRYKVRISRPRCSVRRDVPLWVEETVESLSGVRSRLVCGGVEPHSFPVGLHLLSASTIERLVRWACPGVEVVPGVELVRSDSQGAGAWSVATCVDSQGFLFSG